MPHSALIGHLPVSQQMSSFQTRIDRYLDLMEFRKQLCEEVQLNLAYRWFCHLGIHDRVPDHLTFSKNRHGRFRDSDTFRALFESVLCQCIVDGLVGGEGFATEASVIKVDARRQHAVRGAQNIDWGDPD